MQIHTVCAPPETVQWAAFDASVPPVQRVGSGDVVLVKCLAHHAGDAPDLMMDDGVRAVYDGIPQEERGPGVHIVTGPVFVEGGQAVRRLRHRTRIGATPPGSAERDDPAASSHGYGRSRSGRRGQGEHHPPGRHGGNMDNREFVVGTTMYYPVTRGGCAVLGGRHTLRPGGRRGERHGHRGARQRHAAAHRPQGHAGQLTVDTGPPMSSQRLTHHGEAHRQGEAVAARTA